MTNNFGRAPKIKSRAMGLRDYVNVAYKEDGEDLGLQKQLKSFFTAMQDNLEQKQKDQLQGMILSVETLEQKVGSAASKADLEPLQKELTKIAAQATEMMNSMKANQDVIDKFVAEHNKRESKGETKTFESEWGNTIKHEIEKQKESVMDMQGKKTAKIEFEMKATMTIANTTTGGGVNSYNTRQGILPSQKINMRDLMSTVYSKNGLFVTYRETNSLQAPGHQTEGSDKTNMQYAFTAGTTTLKYLAGYVTFSKQLLFNLDFLENTLPRMLQRDFFKKENDYFYTQMASNATGTNTAANPTPTVDIEELVRMIANQLNANFEASYSMVDWIEWGRILLTKPNDYSLPAGTVVNNQGIVTVAGVPLIGASYAQSDHVLLWDRDYVERVEGESLRVEFSYENNDNFQKNLITARIECFEEINLLLPQSIIYRDFGNS
jgi:hypothetical protein